MIIKCQERLCEAQEYAATLGDKSLQKCLAKLESWEHDGRIVSLYGDFAPYSFGFSLYGPDGQAHYERRPAVPRLARPVLCRHVQSRRPLANTHLRLA